VTETSGAGSSSTQQQQQQQQQQQLRAPEAALQRTTAAAAAAAQDIAAALRALAGMQPQAQAQGAGVAQQRLQGLGDAGGDVNAAADALAAAERGGCSTSAVLPAALAIMRMIQVCCQKRGVQALVCVACVMAVRAAAWRLSLVGNQRC
jgi:hypothetical protein